ncbi:hypothetical protein OAK92_00885 [Crocinitomicaceae bacterium]|nr:hypothetical protein [Crocinitomicaceae bacterium]
MPNQLNSGELIANISSELADNNAGLISAFDVRHNLEDIAFSINKVVASGDTDDEFPFFNVLRVSASDSIADSAGADHGDIVVESGIFFAAADSPLDTKRQTEPWLGDESIDHGSIQGLADDDHLQYFNRLGVDAGRGNALLGNMATDDKWINTSGINNVGFKFEQTNADATEQIIHVSGVQKFAEDNSIQRTGKGLAKAWLNFDASGTYNGVDNLPVVRSYHNISGVQRDAPGKFTITFIPGTWENNEYVAVGTANARNSKSSAEDFEINTVGIVERQGTSSGPTGRTCSVSIVNQAAEYVDSERIDLVFYGYSPSETSGVVPTMTQNPSYPI